MLPGAEFQLVGEAAVVLVQLALFPADLILGEPGALQGGCFCSIVADVAAGGSTLLLRDREIFDVVIIGEDVAGGGVDLIVVLGGAAVELDVVDPPPVVLLERNAVEGKVGNGHTGVVGGDLFGLLLGDGGGLLRLLFAGLSGGLPGNGLCSGLVGGWLFGCLFSRRLLSDRLFGSGLLNCLLFSRLLCIRLGSGRFPDLGHRVGGKVRQVVGDLVVELAVKVVVAAVHKDADLRLVVQIALAAHRAHQGVQRGAEL